MDLGEPEAEALLPLGGQPARRRGWTKRLMLVLLLPPALWLSMVFPAKYIDWRASTRATVATPARAHRTNDAEFHSFCDHLRYTVCFSVVALGVAFMIGILCHGKKGHRPVRLLGCYTAAFLVFGAVANTIGFAREWEARGYTSDLHNLGLNAEWLGSFWKGQRSSASKPTHSSFARPQTDCSLTVACYRLVIRCHRSALVPHSPLCARRRRERTRVGRPLAHGLAPRRRVRGGRYDAVPGAHRLLPRRLSPLPGRLRHRGGDGDAS